MASITHPSGGITIEHTFDELEQQLRQFGEVGVRRANYRAMNRGLAKGKTIATRLISDKRNLVQKIVRPNIRLVKATPGRLSGSINAKGAMIPLYKSKGAKTQTKLGVKVSPEKGRRVLVKGAFIAQMANGKVGIFKRVDGVPRLPIRELTQPSIAHTMIRDDISDKIIEAYNKQWEIDIERQLNNEITKAQAGLR